jgi:hypothetical protein
LESILEFKKAVRGSGASFELKRPGKNRKTVSLSADAYKVIDTRKADPMKLWGTWPGDESIDELLEALNA